jgi:hypothetical protein
VNHLDDIYRRLSADATLHQLAGHYRTALRHGASSAAGPGFELARPILLLAAAIPPCATAGTAITMLHAVPSEVDDDLPEQLVDIPRRNVAVALYRCHRTLELDGANRGYTIDEWLPAVYDIAGPLLQSARPDTEQPTLVQATQGAISWLSRAIADLDQGSDETSTSLAETLACLLGVWTFTDAALQHRRAP